MNQEIFATRKLQFCAGHRVLGHEGKCAMVHGHNYEVHAKAMLLPRTRDEHGRNLDPIGRVVDFSVLKDKLGGWIDQNWDHKMILAANDAEALAAVSHIRGQEVFRLPSNPTAENLASYLLGVIGPRVLPADLILVSVIVWETPNCYAEATIT